jgi:cytochrome c-type biogenesis protein CcmF
MGAAGFFRLLGTASALTVLTLALTTFTAAAVGVDFVRAVRARLRMGERVLPAVGGLLVRHNRRYGGFVIHVGILIVALGVMGSHAWSVQTETTLKRGEAAELAGYKVRFDGLAAREESNHFKVVGTFTVSDGKPDFAVLRPAKKFYPQEQSPIAGVDYRLGLKEDVYLVLGDFARDGSHATIKLQINRLVSWIWIGGLILTLGTALALVPDRRRPA